MDTALPGIASAPAKDRPASPARWIVAATLACWIIFPFVMGYLFATFPYDDGDYPPAMSTTFLLLAALPGVAALLAHLSPTGLFYCVLALLASFTWLESLAWKHRITWLAVVLLAWLLGNMALILSAYRML